MSDNTFQWSMITLTLLVIAWIVLGIVLSLLHMALIILIAIVIEVGLGGYLLHRWGKDYMERSESM